MLANDDGRVHFSCHLLFSISTSEAKRTSVTKQQLECEHFVRTVLSNIVAKTRRNVLLPRFETNLVFNLMFSLCQLWNECFVSFALDNTDFKWILSTLFASCAETCACLCTRLPNLATFWIPCCRCFACFVFCTNRAALFTKWSGWQRLRVSHLYFVSESFEQIQLNDHRLRLSVDSKQTVAFQFTFIEFVWSCFSSIFSSHSDKFRIRLKRLLSLIRFQS